jgi:hypothetical protein
VKVAVIRGLNETADAIAGGRALANRAGVRRSPVRSPGSPACGPRAVARQRPLGEMVCISAKADVRALKLICPLIGAQRSFANGGRRTTATDFNVLSTRSCL